MKRTIYIVDDHPFVREALTMLIEDERDLEVCGMAETAAEALNAIPEVNPDLVLVDGSLPGLSGIELIEQLLILKPHQRTLMLSGHAEPVYAEQALAAGAKGYILKGDSLAILEGIRHVLGGKVYLSRPVRTQVLRHAKFV